MSSHILWVEGSIALPTYEVVNWWIRSCNNSRYLCSPVRLPSWCTRFNVTSRRLSHTTASCIAEPTLRIDFAHPNLYRNAQHCFQSYRSKGPSAYSWQPVPQYKRCYIGPIVWSSCYAPGSIIATTQGIQLPTLWKSRYPFRLLPSGVIQQRSTSAYALKSTAPRC